MHALREIDPGNYQDIATITQLHMELLDFGPMAGLGELFIREMCYAVPLKDGLMRVALYEVDGRPAGFIAYTCQSITFHRRLLRKHWLYAYWVLLFSILRDPRRLLRLARAVRVVISRRAEQKREQDPLAEVVCICVCAEYLTPDFVRRSGLRIGEELLAHAASYFRRAGLKNMRMIVDADNKVTLLFYHRLGARFEPYEQAGEPKVHVWFSFDEQPMEPSPEIPPCWSLEPQTAQSKAADRLDGWASYWEELGDHQQIFRAVADEYFRKLELALALDPKERVLDFGCGFGLVADALAPKVCELFLWDASANMRCRARVNVAGHRNVRFLDLSNPESLQPDLQFDLILVNSVVQYMSLDEFCQWLARWKRVLAPHGRVLISDLVPPDYHFLIDLIDFLQFSARRGLLMRTVWLGLGEIRSYWTVRHMRGLFRIGREDLRQWGEAAGYSVDFLSVNLAYLPGRMTAVLSPAGGSSRS